MSMTQEEKEVMVGFSAGDTIVSVPVTSTVTGNRTDFSYDVAWLNDNVRMVNMSEDETQSHYKLLSPADYGTIKANSPNIAELTTEEKNTLIDERVVRMETPVEMGGEL